MVRHGRQASWSHRGLVVDALCQIVGIRADNLSSGVMDFILAISLDWMVFLSLQKQA